MGESSPVQAKVSQISQWSPIWIVPVVAFLVGGWMLFHTYSNQGQVVTLLASSAEGIVSGKTQLKSRSVDVGKVMSVELSQDLKQVVIKARMNPGTDKLLNDESLLWVVKPTVGRGGVSGLNTLLSGAYIELQPGKSQNNKVFFELLETPPIAPADAAGVRVYLTSQDASALAIGDQVLFHGYEVGTVEDSKFDIKLRTMRYQLFIRAPYDALVTDNVRFWKTSGMALDMSADGVRVEMASLTSLLGGGVTFDVLDGWPQGNKVDNNSEFQLFANKKSIQDGLYNEYLEYLLFFDESIRGLAAGAPVEYRGIRIGTVAAAPYFFNVKNPLKLALEKGIPVLIRIEAGRMYDQLTLTQLQQEIEQAVQQGLTGVLKTGNLLTGGLYVDLTLSEQLPQPITAPASPSEPQPKSELESATDASVPENTTAQAVPMTPAAVFAEQSQFKGYRVLPTARSGLGHIEQKVVKVLDKLNNLPVEQLLGQTSGTLLEAQQMLAQTTQLLQSIDALVKQQDTQQLPADMQKTLQQIRQTLAGFSPGAPAYERLNGNLQSLDRLLRDLQPVVQTLNQQSNALILGADKAVDPEPPKGQ